jgi:hypothetical protein
MSRIRYYRLAAAGICLWLVTASAAPPQTVPPGWREFGIPAGRFQVLMPGAPKTTRQTIRTDIGNVAATRYTVTDASNVTYDVLLNDYPPSGIAKATPQKLLEGARDGLMYQTQGRMMSDKPVTLDGFPGRDLEIMGANGSHYRARLVWVDSRLYQVMAVTPGPPLPASNIFFDSFRITGSR